MENMAYQAKKQKQKHQQKGPTTHRVQGSSASFEENEK